MENNRKSILVTGASQGLGAALCRKLVAAGARVVGVARSQSDLDAVGGSVRHEPGEFHSISADVGNKEETHRITGAAAALVGPIDVLVHNASTLGRTPLRLLLDTECEEFERVLQVNLLGPFRISKIIAGSMALRGGGTIVHITSDAAVHAYASWGGYSVSKIALEHLGRILSAELGEHGVRVLNVDPGEMRTAMHAAALPDADPLSLAEPELAAQKLLRLISESPSGRFELSREGVS